MFVFLCTKHMRKLHILALYISSKHSCWQWRADIVLEKSELVDTCECNRDVAIQLHNLKHASGEGEGGCWTIVVHPI